MPGAESGHSAAQRPPAAPEGGQGHPQDTAAHLAVVLHILLEQLQLFLLLGQGRLLLFQLRAGIAEYVDLLFRYFLFLHRGHISTLTETQLEENHY